MTANIHARKPEIMSPAGYWPQLQAAIEAGADAVYFGLKHFTARAKVGLSLEELPEAIRTLHQRGVKGYVTFNTLVFDHELAEAAQSLYEIAKTGADAIIVQDLAVARLARQIDPTLEIHGSTQMSITSAEGIHLAQQFGVSRVVLARELSLAEIHAIRADTDCELEIFVHGALCVSYSGQCFSSEAWGGRSANRGQCAQACRLPYEMLMDGRLKPLGDARYLLSPGDLYALDYIPEIVQLGVSALKIEGRYKDANYVALTTQAYRRAVDAAWAAGPAQAGLPAPVPVEEKLQLEQVYSRGLGPYFVSGTDHQAVVKGRSPRHRGVLLGRVARVLADRAIITPAAAHAAAPLKAGDGVVFDAAGWRSPEEPEEGGSVYQVTPTRNGQLEVQFGNGAVHFGRLRAGDLLWRTYDPDTEKAARPFTQATAPVHKQPVHVRLAAHEGAPLRLVWTLAEQPQVAVTVTGAETLAAAQNRTLSPDFARQQLGRLGNTPYELADLQMDLRGNPFVPSSVLNTLRREAVEKLAAAQGRPRPATLREPLTTLAAVLDQSSTSQPEAKPATPQPSTLGMQPSTLGMHLLVRTPEQLAAALELAPASITLDYLELYGLRPAVEQVQARGITARVASPRILKPSEQRIIHFLLKLNCQILVRSGGLLQALRQAEHPPLIGDFSLNAANVVAAHTYLQLGLSRITPTHDLNAAQVTSLAREIGPEQMEVIAYQHLPVFHTEHCVFCRFLSQGTSYKDCGHPCEKHRVALRDTWGSPPGRAHPVMADVGCRNTVFGAEAQEASLHLDAWRAAGIRHYRLEFVHESAIEVAQIAGLFGESLSGKLPAAELARRLQRTAPQGTTQGSLFVPENFLTIPLMQWR